MKNVAILIPTLNGGEYLVQLFESLKVNFHGVTRKVIIDSGSSDDTVSMARANGFEVITIIKADFDHGYARQLLAEAVPECEILVYLTQDAIPLNALSLTALLSAFDDPEIGIAYGRQMPHAGAKELESHLRFFNYPPKSQIRSLKDADQYGIKTVSCSNSFAAYRREALDLVGGFPSNTILGEDVIVAGKMLLKGWKLAYVAEAMVYHSHNYSVKEEFKRYFDIGVFHSTNEWLLEDFGKANGEGLKYLKYEVKFVFRTNILVFPKMLGSIFAKFIGYKLGSNYQYFSNSLNKTMSMHKSFWDKRK